MIHLRYQATDLLLIKQCVWYSEQNQGSAVPDIIKCVCLLKKPVAVREPYLASDGQRRVLDIPLIRLKVWNNIRTVCFHH